MKKTVSLLFFVIITIFPLSAQDSKWKEMAIFEGKEIYIDTTSIERNETHVSVWVKELYTKDFEKEAYTARIKEAMAKIKSGEKIWKKKWSKKFTNLSYTLSKRVYNCVESTYQVLEVIEYDIDNKKIVKKSWKRKDAPWRPIEYDTIGDIIMFEVCDNY